MTLPYLSRRQRRAYQQRREQQQQQQQQRGEQTAINADQTNGVGLQPVKTASPEVTQETLWTRYGKDVNGYPGYHKDTARLSDIESEASSMASSSVSSYASAMSSMNNSSEVCVMQMRFSDNSTSSGVPIPNAHVGMPGHPVHGSNCHDSSSSVQGSEGAAASAQHEGVAQTVQLDASRTAHRSQQQQSQPPPSTVPKINYSVGKLLGKGSFGAVYMGLDQDTGKVIAIKKMQLGTGATSHSTAEWDREIETMKKLRHRHIVTLLGVVRTPTDVTILMEYVPGNSLKVFLKNVGALPEKVIAKYMRQMMEALQYCHESSVIHRDIKSLNILVDPSGVIKLADFGSAKLMADQSQEHAPSRGYNYTPLWLAPEVLTKGSYTSKVDIWSMGCVMIEMATAKDPWHERKFDSPWQCLFHIGKEGSLPALPTDVLSKRAIDFMSHCLTRDPAQRWSAKQLLQHPFLNEPNCT